MNAEDQHDIDETLAGRTEAFGRLVVRYQDRLFNGLYSMLGSADDARDASQEAFVNAFQKLETFRGQSAFYSWLFRIAYNAAISQKRKTKRQKGSIEQTKDATGIEPIDTSRESDPGHPAELSEQQELVRHALSELIEEFRVPLVMKEVEGLKYEEIADVIGCPIGTVRSRIHRARSELREKLRILMQDQL